MNWHNCGMANPPPYDWAKIKRDMKQRKLTQTALAEALGLRQSAVSNIFKGTRQVKVQEAAILDAFLGIDTSSAVVFLPIIGLAGAGAWQEAIEHPDGEIPAPRGLGGPNMFAVRVVGDSMDLIVEDGGYVIVDPDARELFAGRSYLLMNGDNEATCKVYKSDPARFEPASSNPAHTGFQVGEHEFRVIGRLVWKGSPV